MTNPPEGTTAPASPPPIDPREKVKMPSILLIVAAAIGSVFCVLMLLLNVLGTGLSAMSDPGEGRMIDLFSGGIGILFDLLGIAIAGFIVYGALQMKNLQNHGLALAAAVVSMVPCLSPCCLFGLPAGIWALVILNKPDVKAAFAKK